MVLKKYCIDGEEKIKLKNFDTGASSSVKEDKEIYIKKTAANLKKMEVLQDRLYAAGEEALVVVFQAMDAAGKDGTIKHVMSGVNPQGVSVYSFKAPTSVELSHDFMWRIVSKLPERGKIAIFNRSYYEDVLVVKVHKLYENYKMAKRCKTPSIIEKRYDYIKSFEEHLYDESFRVVKIFLNVSKDEQKERFLERIDQKIKNWKFSTADLKERKLWDEYQDVYEDMINATATKHAPWYVLPADNKWYTRYLVSEAIVEAMEKIDPKYPEMAKDERAFLATNKEALLDEKE